MAIGDIVTDAELDAPATPASGAVFTDADLDAMDAQADSLATINKAYAASFSDSDQNRAALRQAATGAVPTFSYSTGVPGAGPLQGPRVFTSQELDAQAADSLEDPNTILTLNQYQDAKEASQRLGRDSVVYQAPKALGGLLQTAYGASKELRDNVGMESILGGPGAVVRKLLPSAYEGILRKGPVGSVGFWSGVQNSLNNSFNAKQHQIDAANELASAGALTGTPEDQQKLIDDRAAQFALAAGDGPEDVKLRDWQNYAFHKGIDQEMVNPQMTKLPGQDLLPKPLPNLSDAAAMLSPTPENLAMIAAGELGGPLLGTAVKATSGRALSAIASGGMKVDQSLIDAGAAMGRKIEDITGFAPATLKKAGDFVAGAGGISAVGGVVGAVDPEYSKAAAEAAIAYGLLRKGAAIIRVGSKAAGTAGVFFREAADPMGPLRAEAIRSMALDPSIPEAYRAGMLSTASAIDSTPKRIAANPELSDNVRKLGRALSNPAVVAGVRGAGAIAEGATAGALSMTPLMLASQNEGEPGSLAVTGAAMGAVGRGLGMIGSRTRQVDADIGRFLVDTQLSGGNVERTALLSRTRLEQMASFQGMLNRKGGDLIPLSGQEYSANIMALGGTPGSAGFHLETPADGGRPRLLVNLDAKAVSEGHEFGHAVAASNVLGGRIRADIFNWVNQTYGTDGVLARGREYVKRVIESEDRAYEAQYPTGSAPIRSLPDMESRISMRMDELGQQSLKEGNADPLDWARNEIWAEQLSNGGIDLNKIRRGTPLGIDPAAMGESMLGGASRVLRTLGVAIDDQTGKVQGSLSSIFKENPLVGNSPKLRKALANYVEAYDRWLPGVAEESTKSAPGIRVAPTGNITDFINSPLTKLHETRPGIRENEFILEENGVPRFKTQAEINADAKAKEAQVGMLYTPGRLLPRDSSEFGPRKIDGRIVVGGPVLPAQFDGLAHFSPYLRKAARDVEANRAAGGPGSSFNVIYHRIGTSESGTFKVINRGNTEAVMREVVPFGWRVSNANKILANVLDMTALRGSVMKALNEGRMGIFNHSLDQFSGDLKTYFANHSQGLAGENRIGLAKKNAIDSFLFAGATKANRAANPVYGDFGTRGTIRTLRLDRIQSIEPTGRGGLHFDYDKVNHNLMPDVAERPAGQAMPDVGGTGKAEGRPVSRSASDDSSTESITGQAVMPKPSSGSFQSASGSPEDPANLTAQAPKSQLPISAALVPSYRRGNAQLQIQIEQLQNSLAQLQSGRLNAATKWSADGTSRVTGFDLGGTFYQIPQGVAPQDFAAGMIPKLQAELSQSITAQENIQAALHLSNELAGFEQTNPATRAGWTRQERMDAKQSTADYYRSLRASQFASLLNTRDELALNRAKPELSKLWNEYAKDPEVFQYGKTSSPDISDITRAVSTPASPITADLRNGKMILKSKNGMLEIKNPDSQEPHLFSLYAESAGKEKGGGIQLVTAAMDWIHNNGKQLGLDTSVSGINAIRRTSAMLGSALRWGSTDHLLKPYADQGVKWSGNSTLDIANLAIKEMENAFQTIPQARDWKYDFKSGEIADERGRFVSGKELKSAVLLGNPERSGIGLSTLRRAVLTRSALEAFDGGKLAPQLYPGRSAGSGLGVKGIAYAAAGLLGVGALSGISGGNNQN